MGVVESRDYPSPNCFIDLLLLDARRELLLNYDPFTKLAGCTPGPWFPFCQNPYPFIRQPPFLFATQRNEKLEEFKEPGHGNQL